MSAAIASEKIKHYPVLLNELISIISPQNGGTFIDCTFGHGGYSEKILQYPKTKIIAFDRDKKSIPYAKNLKDKFMNESVKDRLENFRKQISIEIKPGEDNIQKNSIENDNNISDLIHSFPTRFWHCPGWF